MDKASYLSGCTSLIMAPEAKMHALHRVSHNSTVHSPLGQGTPPLWGRMDLVDQNCHGHPGVKKNQLVKLFKQLGCLLYISIIEI